MSNKMKKALQKALDALGPTPPDCCGCQAEWQIAITAIKEALAESEQEPVAWRAWVSKFPQGTGSDWVYVTKPIMKDSIHNQPLYTTPPQRTWVGLTRIELIKCGVLPFGMSYELYEAIEQALKERNT